MSELAAQWKEWRATIERRLPAWWSRAAAIALVIVGVVLPLFLGETSAFLNATITALAYVVMALGLNIVVGFAGLLDLGYVAFFAIGAYTIGWFGSSFFFGAHLHLLVTGQALQLPGIHLNFLLILLLAALLTAVAGTIIGLPTLRLRGDYIAIVTLAFGEIIRVFAINGDSIYLTKGATLTAGRQGITPVDAVTLPFVPQPFDQLHLRPWYWSILGLVLIVVFVALRVRDSRLGRAWIALREDEVAAVSMGIPLVRTKLLAYATGAAFGGISGAFLGAFLNTVNADQFAFSFSIFVLGMVIVGGVGSIWGAVLGALLLSYVNYYLIPDVLNPLPSQFGLQFNLTDLSFGIYGVVLVLVMVLRPQGLFPERRRKLELADHVGARGTELTGTEVG